MDQAWLRQGHGERQRAEHIFCTSRFADDPEVADEIIELLHDPDNYVYYQEIINILKDYEIYNDYRAKLRMAAFKAMQNDLYPLGMENE